MFNLECKHTTFIESMASCSTVLTRGIIAVDVLESVLERMWLKGHAECNGEHGP